MKNISIIISRKDESYIERNNKFRMPLNIRVFLFCDIHELILNFRAFFLSAEVQKRIQNI